MSRFIPRFIPEPRPERGDDLKPSPELQAQADQLFTPIMPESQSTFESRTGDVVNQKITVAITALEEALRCMRAGNPYGGNTAVYCHLSEQGQAMMQTPTYQRLMLLRLALQDLERCTQPVVSSRF